MADGINNYVYSSTLNTSDPRNNLPLFGAPVTSPLIIEPNTYASWNSLVNFSTSEQLNICVAAQFDTVDTVLATWKSSAICLAFKVLKIEPKISPETLDTIITSIDISTKFKTNFSSLTGVMISYSKASTWCSVTSQVQIVPNYDDCAYTFAWDGTKILTLKTLT